MKKFFFYLFLFSSILLITCQKEVSFETGGAPSHGSLLDDGSGDCLPKTVNGTYIEDTALKVTNTIQVAVNVTKTGKYTIVSDTVNGYYFKATGIFSTVGSNSVTLKGFGTPAAPGVNNFLIQYDSSACNVAVTVLPAGSSVAVGTLDGAPNACTPVTVNGTYTQGTALVSGTNTVQIRIDVTVAGSYNITATSSSNPGFSFSGTGTVAVGADQLITLNGSGNPTASGTITFAVTFGTSVCTFTVNVAGGAGSAVGTLDGSPNACAPITVNGTYTQNTALVSGTNTVQIRIDVTTAGSYNISATSSSNPGFSFAGTGTAAVGNDQTITLNGTGTPTASGTITFTVTFGTSTCTFTVNVVASGSNAVGTLDGAPNACAPITVNGTYTQGTALVSGNTVQIRIDVTTAGNYNITASSIPNPGFSFTGSGTVAVGNDQVITLNGTGTPTLTGTITFTVVFGSSICTFTVNVNPSGGGAAVFTVDCSTATIDPDALFEATLQFNCTNRVDIDVNVTTLGTYNISTATTNGMTFSASGTFTMLGVQTITLVGSSASTPLVGGPFNITVNATPTCTFPLTVEPATTDVGWSFTVTNAPATTYKGQEDLAQLIANPPGSIFALAGSNTWGTDALQFALSDANGTIAVGETYSTSAITGNQAAFQYDIGLSPYCADTYKADPSVTGVSITFTITSHNTTTKIIKGTFTGTAKNSANQTITITSGTFTTEFTPYN